MILYISAFTTVILFALVMFYLNPLIDSKYGFDMLILQLSFKKDLGVQIVNSWTEEGLKTFFELIWIDYLYAISYSIFFSSLLYKLQNTYGKNSSIIYIPFLAGMFDFIENTLEIIFIKDMSGFRDSLFFLHSVVASLKWLILPVVIFYIAYYIKNDRISRSIK